ncbi:MAG: hypothetical protein ACRDKV_05115 [Solirubrobacterales bacterium]
MKSAPELWELLDDELQLRDWSARLCKGAEQVEVTTHEPDSLLAWRCDGVRSATVEVSLAEKGFGTQVVIEAEADDGLREPVLDQVLDELAEPQRRPFSAV